MNDIIINKDGANAASMNAGNLGSERQKNGGAQAGGTPWCFPPALKKTPPAINIHCKKAEGV
jgi:hypothetical protein